jgi:hypothetical protein
MLRVVNAQTHVDGSCRLRAIGSGVHHLDAHFFARQQVADVSHQSLSVYRDNGELSRAPPRRVRPGRGDQSVRLAALMRLNPAQSAR